jgi:hypothetical protein
MRRALRLLPLLSLAATGCEHYPEDPVFAYGKVLRADGSPVAGQTVAFDRGANPDTLSSSGEVYPLPDFQPFTTATTLPDGSFTLELTFGDLFEELSPGEQPRDFRFRTVSPLDETGQAAIGSFAIRGGDVELPPLRPWNTNLGLSSTAAGPAVTFAAPPPVPERPLAARPTLNYDVDGTPHEVDSSTPSAVVQLHGADGLVWQQLDASSPWVPSAYVLEDFASEAQVRALSVGSWHFQTLGGSSGSLDFRLEWRGGRVALPAGTRLPLSRGAACWPARDGACPWTDGKLAPVVLAPPIVIGPDRPGPVEPPREPPVFVKEVGVSLAAPTRVSRAVLRGLRVSESYPPQQTVVLQGSEDGTAWRTLARVPVPGRSSDEPPAFDLFLFARRGWTTDNPYDVPLSVGDGPFFLEVPLTDPAPVRHVRLHVESVETAQMPLGGFSELSLFE